MKDQQPIYEDELVQISHATDSAVPGFYKIRPSLRKERVVNLSDKELAVFAYMQRLIRAGIRELAGLAVCGLYVEEHPGTKVTSNSIPFYYDQLTQRYSVDVYQPHTEEYLKSYTYEASHNEIEGINEGMRRLLNSWDTKQSIEHVKSNAGIIQSGDMGWNNTMERAIDVDEILEVYEERELPPAPKGKKYFVCVGGSKNFQCFLSGDNMSKGEFLLSHEEYVDDCLKPIYTDDQILVRQDTKYAIPGFYVVSPRSHYESIDKMPQDVYKKCVFIAQAIERELLTLGLNRTYVYHDEKFKGRMSAHFWIIPIYDSYIRELGLNPTIYSKDIWTYLDTFPRYTSTKQDILESNDKMRRLLNREVNS